MNKEELENAFNETTDNAVKVINDYKKLIVKYNIMKENAKTLAKRINKAIEYIEEEITQGTDIYCKEEVNGIIVLEILKGEDE